MRALVIEDDRTMAGLLKLLLEEERFSVDHAPTGQQGHELASLGGYDAIVLDLRLPDTHGVTVIQKMRRDGKDTPILVLTAEEDDASLITTLDAGADDFLRKPFQRDEFRARIRALTRRGGARRTEVISCGNVVLNRLTRRVLVDSIEIPLTSREMGLLEHFLLHRGELVSRSVVLERLWDLQFDPGTNVVDVNVARLRRKLSAAGASVLISTRRGLGYVLDDSPGNARRTMIASGAAR